jgi:ribosomal protein L16
MLIPKKVKFRKWQTGRSKKKTGGAADTRGIKLAFGSYGLKSETQARVKSTQIESARKVISRTLTKTGKYWVRIFPDRPYTAKAAEVGRGKGKILFRRVARAHYLRSRRRGRKSSPRSASKSGKQITGKDQDRFPGA